METRVCSFPECRIVDLGAIILGVDGGRKEVEAEAHNLVCDGGLPEYMTAFSYVGGRCWQSVIVH